MSDILAKSDVEWAVVVVFHVSSLSRLKIS